MALKPPPPQTIFNCPSCEAELMHEEQLANQCWTCAEPINPEAEPYRPELINEYDTEIDDETMD